MVKRAIKNKKVVLIKHPQVPGEQHFELGQKNEMHTKLKNMILLR